jgi:hypothetical protein
LRGRSFSYDAELFDGDNSIALDSDDDVSFIDYPTENDEESDGSASVTNYDDIYVDNTFSPEIYSADSDSSRTNDAEDNESTVGNYERPGLANDGELSSGNDAAFMDDEERNHVRLTNNDDDDDDTVSNEIGELGPNLRPAPTHSPSTNDNSRARNTRGVVSTVGSHEGKRRGDDLVSEQAKKIRTTRLSTDPRGPAESASSSSFTSTVSVLKLHSNVRTQANTDSAASLRPYKQIRTAEYVPHCILWTQLTV